MAFLYESGFGSGGDGGEPGPANVLTVGTVTTLPAGQSANADITGTSPAQVLNLSIPRGNNGNPGPANTLSIGTVSTLAAGKPATAAITGISPSQTLSLGLPVAAVQPYLQSIFTWIGSQPIINGAFQNFAALNLLAATSNTAGITRVGNFLVFPPMASQSGVVIRTRITGTIGGSSGTAREWFIQTRRVNGTTVIGSQSCVKVTGTPITNRDAVLTSYTLDALDPFTTQGIMVGLDNQSTQTITITAIDLLIQRFVNP